MDNKERARKVQMILMDVDGTLTDGSLLIMPDGEELKSFNVKDGMGILMAHLVGLRTGVITGKTSKSVERRTAKLKMEVVYQGVLDKRKVLEQVLKQHSLRSEEVAYIGDDLGDLEVIMSVGLSAAVMDAHPLVKKHSHFICRSEGGKGAVREFIEFIIEAQDKWTLLEAKVKDLSGLRS